jgi:hypothetical protein
MDEDHLRYGGPLAIATLQRPDEVNDMPERLPTATVDGRPHSYGFFKAFMHGDRLVTILVVVHERDRFAITSYRLEDDETHGRIDKERLNGQLVYSRLPG